MYSTCLFCNAGLGANEEIEAFPVGRRLAFDGAKGRLWVVCRRCERWNLTPLEERWEAIEQCERAFRDTKLRVSTDEIGLARLHEGLELVRIGAPQRPEMAAWRYGDQFGRRRRRAILLGGAAAAAVGGFVIAGPVMGLIGGSSALVNLFNTGYSLYQTRAVAVRVPVSGGASIALSRLEVSKAAILWEGTPRRWSLELSHRPTAPRGRRWWRYESIAPTTTMLMDDAAIHAVRLLMPTLNARGAGRRTVTEAVQYLEQTLDSEQLFTRVAQRLTGRAILADGADHRTVLKAIPTSVRLALEMSANEETERRALEGELHLLEAAWRDAEEIAGIADDMFLPASVDEELKRLKDRSRDSE
jgi:hypothetical protein